MGVTIVFDLSRCGTKSVVTAAAAEEEMRDGDGDGEAASAASVSGDGMGVDALNSLRMLFGVTFR